MKKTFLNLVRFLLILDSLYRVASDAFSDIKQQDSDILGSTDHTFAHESTHRDTVSISMFKVYEKYSKEPHRKRDGNTVRGFKSVPGDCKASSCFQFNLSSIPDSERILSVSVHFLVQRPRPRPGVCRHSRKLSCRLQHLQSSPPPSQLLFRGTSPNSAFPSLLGNLTLPPLRKSAWQTRDVTAVIKHARVLSELLITAELDLGVKHHQQQRLHHQNHPERHPQANLPYMLVYTDDLAIDEPNSVAMTLQRYGPFPVGEEPTRPPNASPPASPSRVRRNVPDQDMQLQTNHLPEVHYNTLKNHELWQSTYFAPKAKPSTVKDDRHKLSLEGSEVLSKPQVLSFDERTMKKARRRQWSEPRACSRRYLRVDFADIGWSEWVLAPKAFDAFYCAGTCGFPIPKVVRPSNHATIQSIVRAVGIVPGVPEPCCVPDKMSPLSVLFLDPDKNMVLKVYPGMSVDTCACR
ncbi:growth/differentiation factor 10b [Osmerus eperlanus]|uniref:growth/differentiation factor 10b n=1 Tax=Osmerus eperlanus TaxID=29151 RepID=UPI002E15E581